MKETHMLMSIIVVIVAILAVMTFKIKSIEQTIDYIQFSIEMER